MARNNNPDPIDTVPHSTNDNSYQAFTLHDSLFAMWKEGTFEDEKTKKIRTRSAGMSLKLPGMEKGKKISARTLAALYNLIKDNEDVRNELQRRYEGECVAEKGF